MQRKTRETDEAELRREVIARLAHQEKTNASLKSLAEVVEELGITAEELEAAGDVEIEDE